MLRKIGLLCLTGMILLLSGCWDSVEIDDQCYLLFIALDKTEKGGIQLSTEIPSSSPDVAKDEKANLVTVAGQDLFDASDLLFASVPLNINMSQLKVVVISEELAQQQDFALVLSDLLSLRGIRRMASIVICEGKAIEYAENIKPFAGMQLSKLLEIAITSYSVSSYQVHSRLLDLYQQMRATHGTGVAASGIVAPKYTPGEELDFHGEWQSQPGSFFANEAPHKGAASTEIFGTALFDSMHMRMKLTGYETQLLCFLRGEGEYNLIIVPKQSVAPIDAYDTIRSHTNIILREAKSPAISLREDGEGGYVFSLDLYLRATLTQYAGDEESLEYLRQEAYHVIQRDALALLLKLQSEGLDPIGFFTAMSRNFYTIGDWEEFDWQSAYTQGKIELNTYIDLLQPSEEPGGLPMFFR